MKGTVNKMGFIDIHKPSIISNNASDPTKYHRDLRDTWCPIPGLLQTFWPQLLHGNMSIENRHIQFLFKKTREMIHMQIPPVPGMGEKHLVGPCPHKNLVEVNNSV